MRVANISLYQQSTYNLSGLTSGLQDINNIMASQKQINTVSDDPVGMSQVLDLNTTLGNLTQIKKNVDMGFAWIKESENALDSVNNLILDVKTHITRLANDSMTADERSDAVASINAAIDQIISLGNTQVNGNYIFGGTDTDTPPFAYDAVTGRVRYTGDAQHFSIKTDHTDTVPVGMAGSAIFHEDIVEINTTNNTIVFQEDIGYDAASKKISKITLEPGTYTATQLEQTIEAQLNQASAKTGYHVTYDVRYNADEKQFAIREDGRFDGYINTEFMWDTGKDAYITGINASDIFGPDGIDIHIINPSALTLATPQPHGTDPLRLSWQGDNTWELADNSVYEISPSSITGTDNRINIDINGDGTSDITIHLDTPAVTKGQFIAFDIVPAQGDKSIGHEIGFHGDNTHYAPQTSDENAVHVTELTFTGTTNQIVFREDGVQRTATIDTSAPYTNMDTLAQEIENKMELAGTVDYAVTYDKEHSRFLIREDGTTLDTLEMEWPLSSAADTLHFASSANDLITYPVSDQTRPMCITIDDTNNQMVFSERNALGNTTPELSAIIESGTYTSAADLEAAVKNAMESASLYGATYTVTYNTAGADAGKISISQSGPTLTGLNLLWDASEKKGHSIGATLGFDPHIDTSGTTLTADNTMTLMHFDETNNKIDFRETATDGTLSDVITVSIPEGDYTNMNDVASALQKSLRAGSPNGVRYEVSYNPLTEKFMVKGSDAAIEKASFYWQTGIHRDSSAAKMLGFYGHDDITFSKSDTPVVNITIDGDNNKLDFREVMPESQGKTPAILTATIKQGTYTHHDDLAAAIELAMEKESQANGNHIDYSVTWDAITQHFTIKESGSEMEGLELLWKTGPHAPSSAGGDGGSVGQILGFHAKDDIHQAMASERDVEWGIFNTLIDIREDLANNNQDGLERAIGRLETHYENMTTNIVDIGIRYNRLAIRDKIVDETQFTFTQRRSEIEDADILESVMKMQNIQIAYQAALSTTSKVMQLSLVDYI